ncbi:MAG: Tad domain-containing protein [Rhodoferax sp.]|uniref:pilus assembly protein TadG-related protein n=1 Tax=Rhodoferax sp. TaxID=50421 RepID=UPI003BAF71FC
MNTVTRLKGTRQQHQRGAVAITFALSLLVLFGFMALVFDLGRTYVVRTELQNAADAAALAGAKDLNQKLSGITQAIATVKAIGLQNNTRFSFNGSTGVVIEDAMISVSNCPYPDEHILECTPWTQASEVTSENVAEMTFISVDIQSGSLATFFARVPTTQGGTGTQETRTYGRAVAGKYLIEITPLAMCALPDDEAAEFGYERGVAYKLLDTNPIGSGTPYWVDAVATSSDGCSGNTNDSLPYVCAGKLTFTPRLNQPVYTNTGISDPLLEALDSRFGVFNNKNKCDAITAPPDANIKEYRCTNVHGSDGCLKNNSLEIGLPRDWMEDSYPTQQSLTFISQHVPKPLADRDFNDYGVLWSASRPVDKTVSDWLDMYEGSATSYPETSPYAQTSGTSPFFSPGVNGKPGRRMLHLLIVDCPSGNGICRPATVLGVGKFFMQRKANVPTDKNIYLEFSGLDSEPLSNAEIRLYR